MAGARAPAVFFGALPSAASPGGKLEAPTPRRFHDCSADLRQLITVLFQMPVRYHATAGQNIALGDLSREYTMDEITTAARCA